MEPIGQSGRLNRHGQGRVTGIGEIEDRRTPFVVHELNLERRRCSR